MSSIQRIWQWIKVSPVTVTFLLSITLSLASSSYRASMNPDGMVHIMAGRIFIEEGFTEALKFFDWPFFSILIGIVGYVLPISYEAAGRLLNILFLAGTCSLLVRVTQRYVPNSAWLACLAVLALPGLNENRHEVMREDGAWFFLILAIWLAIRTPREVNLLNTLGPSAALFLAFLFRAEFAAFYPPLIIWQWYTLEENRNLRNAFRLFALPVTAGLILIAIAVALYGGDETKRISTFINYLNIDAMSERFDTASNNIAKHVMQPKWGEPGSESVLAWGLIGYAINSFIENCYSLTIPLALGYYWSIKNNVKFQPLSLLFFVFGLVIITFVFRHYFLSDRYTAPLAILAIPTITYGLHRLYQEKRMAAWFVAALMALNCLDNIITTGDQDTHLSQAGQWLKDNGIPEEQTYIDYARIAYHADWVKYNFKFDRPYQTRRDRAYNDPKIRYITLWRHSSDEEIKWLEGKQLQLLAEFENKSGRKVLIFKKKE